MFIALDNEVKEAKRGKSCGVESLNLTSRRDQVTHILSRITRLEMNRVDVHLHCFVYCTVLTREL
jgi:hypothetical protein